MKLTLKIIAAVLLFAGAAAAVSASGTAETRARQVRTMTDMAGRSHEVPLEISRIYCKGPMASILLYTLAPDMLLGWNYELTEDEKQYIPEKYSSLPVLGGWFGKKTTANIEEIIAMDPDIILDMDFITDAVLEANDALQKQTGIPVLMLDGSGYERFAEAYAAAGRITGITERAGRLGRYCSDTLADIAQRASVIPDSDRISVYYAEGPEGLQTEAPGSRSTEPLRMVGAVNAADLQPDADSFKMNVSLEQVILWNPDAVITPAESSSKGISFYQNISENRDWREIKAVKNGRIYGIPQNPFGWFDRPPSVNRMIGLKWLGNALYPDIYDYDMVQEVRAFYSLFYHIEPGESGALELLNPRRTAGD